MPATSHKCRWVSNGLFIMADAAAQIARLCDETYLLNRRLVGAGPWKHVADLTDLTFRLLRGRVEVRAILWGSGEYLHRSGDTRVPIEAGRYIANNVPGAKMVTLSGQNHIFVYEPEMIDRI